MRFVSNSSRLSLGNFRNAEEAIGASREVVVGGVKRTTTAESYIVKDAIPIQFAQDELTSDDIAAAKALLRWPGLPVEGDGVTPIDPAEYGRIGVWDSVSWQSKYGLTDDERREAEQMVLASHFRGQHYALVEEAASVAAAAPWPTYDTTHHNRIPPLAEELGVVEDAIGYERANKNRATVIAALEERLPAQAEGELISA